MAGTWERNREKVLSRKRVRPSQCRGYAQRRMAEAMPEIVAGLVLGAKQGSLAHARMLMTLSGFDKLKGLPDGDRTKRRVPRRESLTEMLMRDLKKGCAAEDARSRQG